MSFFDSIPAVEWGIVLGASLTAFLSDMRSRRIPNALTFTLFLSGLAYGLSQGGPAGLGMALLAGVLLALPYILLYAFAGGGAGDAKLMGGIGAWLGLGPGLVVLGCVSFAGVIFATLHAVSQRRLRLTMARVGTAARGIAAPLQGAGSLRDIPTYLPSPEDSQKIPYGAAIFAGTVFAAIGYLLQWFSL